MFRKSGVLFAGLRTEVVAESTYVLEPAMKTTHLATLTSTVLAVCACAWSGALAQSTNPSVPFGKISASPTTVLTGTKPNLTWTISYPSSIKDYVTTTTPGGITPKQTLICDIRILGAGVTTQDSRGRIVYVETVGRLLFNGAASWITIFDGTNNDTVVQQQGIVKSFTANMNQPINFGGYYIFNGVKSTTYTSLSGDNVRFQFNGDTPPSNIPDYNAPTLASFIKPYLDASGKVKIGPMDVIVFMELTHTNKASLGYDLQDLVFLMTFRTP